jgi:hypothetical protein
MLHKESGSFEKKEIEEFLESGKESDFLLELKVAKTLRDAGFTVAHSQHYEDPATKLQRQFDIRAARYRPGEDRDLFLAIECKNLGEEFPILVFSSPVQKEEDYLQLALRDFSGRKAVEFSPDFRPVTAKKQSIFNTEFVGREIDQLKRVVKKGSELDGHYSGLGTTQGIRGKWDQALSSLQAGIFEYLSFRRRATSKAPILPLPILVIPEGTLWQACFSETAEKVGEVSKESLLTIYINKELCLEDAPYHSYLRMPRMVVVEIQRLEELITHLGNAEIEWSP